MFISWSPKHRNFPEQWRMGYTSEALLIVINDFSILKNQKISFSEEHEGL